MIIVQIWEFTTINIDYGILLFNLFHLHIYLLCIAGFVRGVGLDNNNNNNPETIKSIIIGVRLACVLIKIDSRVNTWFGIPIFFCFWTYIYMHYICMVLSFPFNQQLKGTLVLYILYFFVNSYLLILSFKSVP